MLHSEALETWDPLSDPSSPRAQANESLAAEHRRRLYNVRDRLQRAMIVGNQYEVVERSIVDDPSLVTAPYTPASAARFKVISEDSSVARLTTSARRLTSDSQVSAELDQMLHGDGAALVVASSPGSAASGASGAGAGAVAVAGDGPRSAFDRPITFASNTATSILLSRQFEALSRKDIMLEQQQELNLIMHTFFQTTRWRLQEDLAAEARRLAAEVEDIRQQERSQRSLFVQNLMELENACRRRTEALEAECTSRLDLEVSRALSVLRGGQTESRRNWVEQQEERARNALVLECDRQLSRILGVQMSEAQGIAVHALLRERIPHSATGLAVGKTPPAQSASATPRDATATTPAAAAASGGGGGSSSSNSRNEARADMAAAAAAASGADAAAIAAAFANGPAPPTSIVAAGAFNMDDADRSSTAGTSYSDGGDQKNVEMLARFTPHWGWMCKSSGVLMTWQKRFFVFTQRGKLRYSASSEKGPWTTLLSATAILRVEVDSYHDSSHGARPPSDQYHQYGFYVDVADTKTNRLQRVRFCCFSRAELNSWLMVLREACDIVFNLEQMGAIARSPYRRRLDPHVVESLMHTQIGVGKGHVSLTTYRKRAQFEDDLAALEAQQHENDKAQREKSNRAPSPSHDLSPRSGSPPPAAFK